jgi:hypothetical protein
MANKYSFDKLRIMNLNIVKKRNDSGSLVASGVYIIYIKSDSGTKKIKVAVEK